MCKLKTFMETKVFVLTEWVLVNIGFPFSMFCTDMGHPLYFMVKYVQTE